MEYYFLALLIFSYGLWDYCRAPGGRIPYSLNSKVPLLIAVVLVALGGLRWLTGTDWNNYFSFFEISGDLGLWGEGKFEPLYAALNYIVKLTFGSYTAFLLIFSALTIFPKVHAIVRLSSYSGISLFLYYCTNCGDILAVREALAQAALMISLHAIVAKHPFRFLLWVLIAIFIHTSAALWVLAYPLFHARIKSLTFVLGLLLSLVAGYFLIAVVSSVLQSTLLNMTDGSRVFSKVIFYLGLTTDRSPATIALSLIKRFLLIPVLLILRSRLQKKNNLAEGFLNLYLFGSCIYLLFLFSFDIFQRMTSTFLLMEIFLLPLVISLFDKRTKLLILGLVLIYGMLKLQNSLSLYEEVKIPYYSVFSYEDRNMDVWF